MAGALLLSVQHSSCVLAVPLSTIALLALKLALLLWLPAVKQVK